MQIKTLIKNTASTPELYAEHGLSLYILTRRGVAEDNAVVEAIAQTLLKTGAVYHTGHCTGDAVFEQMKRVMGERLLRIRAGVGVSVKNHLYINKEKKEKHNPIF